MTRERSSGPQSATVHVTLSPVETRVTLITVPFGAVRWAQVPSGALYQDARPRSLWPYFAAGLTCTNAGSATRPRVVVVVVAGTAVVVGGAAGAGAGAGPAVVVVAPDVAMEVDVELAIGRTTVVAVTLRVVVVAPAGRVVDVVDESGIAIATGSLTIRTGLTQVELVDAAAPAVTSYRGVSTPAPIVRSKNAGNNSTEAHTPAV